MRYLDYCCAWAILCSAVVLILVTEIWHPRGAILDVPILWMLVAMMNFLRLRNSYTSVRGLKVSCIGTNLTVLAIEIVRLKLLGVVLNNWSPFSLIVALAVLGEAIFSIVRKDGSGSPAGTGVRLPSG
jgi:multisubunit Na+/H+ antiporter MnhG subunit